MNRSDIMGYSAMDPNASHVDADTGSLDMNVTTEYIDVNEQRSDVAILLWIYIAPIIFLVGVAGNVLVLLVGVGPLWWPAVEDRVSA